MGTTIFYGNGINLLSKDGRSWDDILRQISVGHILPPINNNTLKYEYIVLPKDKYTEVYEGFDLYEDGKRIRELRETETDIKVKLRQEISYYKPSYFYEKLAELESDNYITTNYESFLKEPLLKLGYSERDPILNVFSDGKFYKFKPHYTLENSNRHCIRLWNIHGHFDIEEDIMLGLSEYCESVTEMKQIFKVKANHPQLDKDLDNWTNAMLTTDVFIVGFGLGYEEIDIWYFLTIRKRLIRDKQIERNRIVYYVIDDGTFDIGKEKLLEALDVEVKKIGFSWNENGYKEAYDTIYDDIKRELALFREFLEQ